MINSKLENILLSFLPTESVESISPLGEGFINDTYIVKCACSRYILQKKNTYIFRDVPHMMDNILKVTSFIKKNAKEAGLDPSRSTLTVILAADGKPYVFLDGEYWVLTLFIEKSVVYQKADSDKLAYMGGCGVGDFLRSMADFHEELHETIPGFHNMRFRYEQFLTSIDKNLSGRLDLVRSQVDAILSLKDEAMMLWEKFEQGIIPHRVSHNDTKLSNILFDADNRVLCMIDLDTVMSSMALNDFGDSIRSYANLSAEDEPDVKNVKFSLSRFEAFTKGYLSCAKDVLNDSEKQNLAFSAIYITLEQALRFLMDYIDGDLYYKTAYAEHNLVRTNAQLALLNDMKRNYSLMLDIVEKYV
ncbi:MAG: aminoglycoside phosphotransferase family protein [Alistipes sp.]|nr:aminoglycoside phosphotransferase family protein [Candidatus Alistipes equi]